ncbi:MAG: hypothetical protein DDT27_01383 [Dehalococcoidia bacterium]|nr:hypothetical protein [Chloroflexota bacterium]MBT9162818.1 hypothetical protein [Chloroflexota bacterium]
MFTQSDNIRDFVFPLATARRVGNAIELVRFLGTAFVIGNRGFALTARHVIAGAVEHPMIGVFALPDGGWFSVGIAAVESHPSEDVAVVQLEGGPWRSFFRLAGTNENSSARYRLFGYPDDATYELVDSGQVTPRPDLVYNEGYFRRRFTGRLLGIDGSAFFELSQVAGSGASGAPVCKFSAPAWEVMGVYVGEKLNDRATSVSYAVREDAFRDWTPNVLGTTVMAESRNVSV